MSQKTVIAVIVLILVLGGGYLGRHQIKSLLGMTPATPAASDQTMEAPTDTTSSPTSALASLVVMTKNDATAGAYLADSKGMTIYTYDKDTTDKSNCTATCLVNWPIFAAPSADATSLPANIGVITRADGTFEYTYKGLPLYYYVKDTKAGDLMGDGVGGVWHIVKQ